jgi:hypothetical protein
MGYRPLVTTLTGHQGTVTCLGMVEVEALTPTQKRSECSMRRMVSGSDDGSLILWTAKIKSKDTTNNNNILYQQHQNIIVKREHQDVFVLFKVTVVRCGHSIYMATLYSVVVTTKQLKCGT